MMNIYKQNQKTLVYSNKENDINGRQVQLSAVKTLNKINKYPLTITWRNLSKTNNYLSTLFSPLDKTNHGNFYNIHSSKI